MLWKLYVLYIRESFLGGNVEVVILRVRKKFLYSIVWCKRNILERKKNYKVKEKMKSFGICNNL